MTSPTEPHGSLFLSLHVDAVPPVTVGPGCLRRDLPALDGVRVWVVDMAPGSTWPQVDHHDLGEVLYVLSGELIEGDRRLGPGTYIRHDPGSAHRPRTERGTRLFGFHLVAASAGADAAEGRR